MKGLDGNALPGAVPLNRRGVRPYTASLAALAERVGDLSRPVAPRGMLLLEDLLTNGDSPLYARENVDMLPERLREIEHALGDGRLMFDLAAIGIAVACFVFLFALLWAMERV